MTPPLWQKVKSEKVGLKLNIQKTKIMASGPITSWEIDGKTVETVSDFIVLGSKITANGDCSHEIKRSLLFGRKVIVVTRAEPPAFPRNSRGRLGFPGPTQRGRLRSPS